MWSNIVSDHFENFQIIANTGSDFRVCGPKVIWRAEVLDAGPSAFQRDYFQWSIEHPAHLEALLAVSQYVSDKMKHKAQIYSTSVIRHRGKCLKLLRDTLTEVEHLNNDDIMMVCFIPVNIRANWRSCLRLNLMFGDISLLHLIFSGRLSGAETSSLY